jgi:hypothetical protein
MTTQPGLHDARQTIRTIAVLVGLAVVSAQPLLATPPFGHPDQPYDRLPARGTNQVRKASVHVDSVCVDSQAVKVRREITRSGGQRCFR